MGNRGHNKTHILPRRRWYHRTLYYNINGTYIIRKGRVGACIFGSIVFLALFIYVIIVSVS